MSERRAFLVTMPFAGTATVYVEAADKEAAKVAAWDKLDCTVKCENPDVEVNEWEFLDHIVRGNVCSAPQPWSVEVEETEPDGDDR